MYLQGTKEFINYALLFYLVSTIPLALFLDIDNSFLSDHLFLNNILIVVAYIFSRIKIIKPNIISSIFFTKLFNLKIKKSKVILYIIAIVLILLEVLGVLMYDKPFYLSSLFSESLMLDRVDIKEYPFPFNILYSNYYLLVLVLINYFFLRLIENQKIKLNYLYLFLFLIFLCLVLIYLSSFKKASLLYLFLSLAYVAFLSKLLNFNFKTATFSAILFMGFYFSLYSYYGHRDEGILLSIINRVFFEGIQSTTAFYNLYGNNFIYDLNYIPADGSRLWGLDGTPLERELFYEMFQNRANRYGNSPVLSITYGIAILGKYAYLYLFLLYLLVFKISKYLSNNTHSKKLNIVNASFAIYYMPLFLSGAFKVFSIFIFYPLSLLLGLIGILFIPNYVHKKTIQSKIYSDIQTS